MPQKISSLLNEQGKIPLFTPLAELNNRSVYKHLQCYEKVDSYTLADLIVSKLIDFSELDARGKNLMQLIVDNDDVLLFQNLLLAGEKPTRDIFRKTKGKEIGDFLRYKPGSNNPNVYKLSTKSNPDIDKLLDVMYDYDETTDDQSSDAIVSDMEELSSGDESDYKEYQAQVLTEYNEEGNGEEAICLVAARGVHFVAKYFPKDTREYVYNTRTNPHTTFSLSTLIDSGYEADDEPDEDDAAIIETHQRNMDFIATLNNTPDKQEKKIAKRNPIQRNNRQFENLFWREIQVYINSYDTLFNLNGIQINFSFASVNNPHLSLSWKTGVAGMYGGGVRFGWKSHQRFDPHYRRYDGKPKHPNVGYIDVFEFPIDYVRANGVDRLLAYNDNKIDLSNIHLAEGEIIFHSMIPQEFHVRRYMVVLPSFNKENFQAEIDDKYFGIRSKAAFSRAKDGFFRSVLGKPKDQDYQKWVTKRTEHAVKAQAALIDKATDVRLFQNEKIRAYDHGASVAGVLPLPGR